MEPPAKQLFSFLTILNSAIEAGDSVTIISYGIIIFILLFCSAIISGSENAFFSLSKTQVQEITQNNTRTAHAAQYLLSNPKKLLATILISNTFANIAIVTVATLMFSHVFNFEENPISVFLIEVAFVTFIIVLFGEVMPKIYASYYNVKVSRLAVLPMYYLGKVFAPFIWVLIKSTSIIDKRITKKGHILSVDELTHAIDITAEADTPKEEKIILKSIVNFGNINVRQIMRQRPDISALNANMNFTEVLSNINEWGYSRVPVYRDNLDTTIGVLYIKDLLPHLNQGPDFKWLSLLRKPYFIPESKKIDDLLKEFQSKRVHLAVVVDEFGGTSGIVTMEDILEEIFGEIHDEFDEDENFYSKINDYTYVFEAKIPINDMCKLMQIDSDTFDDVREEADTLGGMLLELSEELPAQDEEIKHGVFTFTIESVDKRRIKRVKVVMNKNKSSNE